MAIRPHFHRSYLIARSFALALGVVTVTLPTFSVAQQSTAIAALEVRNDRGGSLRERLLQLRELERTGQSVRITGNICYSTCTMFLGLPQTCVSPRTVFGFHGPSSFGRPLPPAVFERASVLIAESYPRPLQQWYMDTARHRTVQLYRIGGDEMIRLGVKQC